jgi:hypothetical protein
MVCCPEGWLVAKAGPQGIACRVLTALPAHDPGQSTRFRPNIASFWQPGRCGGSCQITTGAALTTVRMPARILLILTGLSTLGTAATPEPATGPTPPHFAFATSCVVTTAVWPVLVARRAAAQSWILHAESAAARR